MVIKIVQFKKHQLRRVKILTKKNPNGVSQYNTINADMGFMNSLYIIGISYYYLT